MWENDSISSRVALYELSSLSPDVPSFDPRDRDKAVVTEPLVFSEQLLKVCESGLELVCARIQGGRIGRRSRFNRVAEVGQVGNGTAIGPFVEFELQQGQNALDLLFVVRIFGGEEQMEIDPLTLIRLDVEPHLDIWEQELDCRHPPPSLMFSCLAIRLDREVIRDAECFHGW